VFREVKGRPRVHVREVHGADLPAGDRRQVRKSDEVISC